MRRWLMALSLLLVVSVCLQGTVLAQGRSDDKGNKGGQGQGDNQDDENSGQIDDVGDGDSGQGNDDLDDPVPVDEGTDTDLADLVDPETHRDLCQRFDQDGDRKLDKNERAALRHFAGTLRRRTDQDGDGRVIDEERARLRAHLEKNRGNLGDLVKRHSQEQFEGIRRRLERMHKLCEKDDKGELAPLRRALKDAINSCDPNRLRLHELRQKLGKVRQQCNSNPRILPVAARKELPNLWKDHSDVARATWKHNRGVRDHGVGEGRSGHGQGKGKGSGHGRKGG